MVAAGIFRDSVGNFHEQHRTLRGFSLNFFFFCLGIPYYVYVKNTLVPIIALYFS